ncbi:hypothetical protein HY493_05670 [Candidatus Woesearchaeota archaeon]|nr:hypothetical protein [Candidatus Woesearchaeota archaeon]
MRWALPVLKGFSIFLLFLIVVSFVLAIIDKLAWLAFWIIAALVALCAYVLIPRIRKVIERY